MRKTSKTPTPEQLPANVTPFPTPEAPAPLPPATTEQTAEYLRQLEAQLVQYLTAVRLTLTVMGA
jgi:hypothetical protein